VRAVCGEHVEYKNNECGANKHDAFYAKEEEVFGIYAVFSCSNSTIL